jgi:predicted O-linked N-acetylglucosamine transferase (SPINDLY family)
MDQITIQQAFDLALAHHQAGRLPEAEKLYKQILANEPAHFDATHLLGVVALQRGQNDIAVDLINRAITLRPGSAQAYSNLGNALKGKGQLDEAVAAYRRAIALIPGFAEAHSNLGNALREQGQLDEAIAAFGEAISLKPNLAEAHSDLGNVLRDTGQLGGAIAEYRKAIALKHNFTQAHNNLGNALKEKGLWEQAIAAYRRAIALRPDYAQAHSNLGNVLRDNGQLDGAIAAYLQAVTLLPGYAEGYSNLGNALKDKGQLDDAIAAYRQAVALKPNLPEAHNNLGSALRGKGQLDNAIAACREAIILRPDYAEAHSNLGNALREKGEPDDAEAACRQAIALNPNLTQAQNNLGNALKDKGQLDGAVVAYRRAVALNPKLPDIQSNLLFALQYHHAYDAWMIAQECRGWDRQHAEPLRRFIQPHTNDRDPDRRLRIGYVSPDFREHCQAQFTVPLLAHHDHEQFEIVCYASVLHPDAITTRLRGYCDLWRDVGGINDEQLAKIIRDDGIDVLVDLTMHMAANRLGVFARKPAPVQVTWLAYLGTTGLATMDYRLTDPYLDPSEISDGSDERVYCEQSIWLPDTFWCYDPLTTEQPVNALPAETAEEITFGCLNNFCKTTDGTLDLWAKVLTAVPKSRLLLLAPPGSPRQRVLDRLSHAGVAAERIEFVAKQSRADYLQTYHRIDIALDTIPYNGHTTSLDAFWMGVPVVTLVGQRVVGRAGLSQLCNLGLRQLAAESADQFVRIAVDLASDLPRLSELRSNLRQRMSESPLMDAPLFAKNIEQAYRQMWRRWCEAIFSRGR